MCTVVSFVSRNVKTFAFEEYSATIDNVNIGNYCYFHAVICDVVDNPSVPLIQLSFYVYPFCPINKHK